MTAPANAGGPHRRILVLVGGLAAIFLWQAVFFRHGNPDTTLASPYRLTASTGVQPWQTEFVYFLYYLNLYPVASLSTDRPRVQRRGCATPHRRAGPNPRDGPVLDDPLRRDGEDLPLPAPRVAQGQAGQAPHARRQRPGLHRRAARALLGLLVRRADTSRRHPRAAHGVEPLPGQRGLRQRQPVRLADHAHPADAGAARAAHPRPVAPERLGHCPGAGERGAPRHLPRDPNGAGPGGRSGLSRVPDGDTVPALASTGTGLSPGGRLRLDEHRLEELLRLEVPGGLGGGEGGGRPHLRRTPPEAPLLLARDLVRPRRFRPEVRLRVVGRQGVSATPGPSCSDEDSFRAAFPSPHRTTVAMR